MKIVTPSITKKAFSCPHCGAYTSHTWFQCRAKAAKDNAVYLPDKDYEKNLRDNPDLNANVKRELAAWAKAMLSKRPFLGDENSIYTCELENVFTSECFHCKQFSIWLHDTIIYPNQSNTPAASEDLPVEIRPVYEEARSIVEKSPRGSTALLRLCLQMLMPHLGEQGKDINKDIASLVSKGLNPQIQKSLDILRVIGNEAVHPGEIDLNDNKDIALALFQIINSIVDQMISHPKAVKDLYSSLPAGKIEGIQKRDQKS
jgi:hypothetical protein